MAGAIFDTMGETLTRWTMGSAAAPAASQWKSELGSEPQEAELRLLALSGQFLTVAVTAEPPAGLRTLPDIPLLALPTVPAASRPLVRRALATKETRLKADILQFLSRRGWTVHPGDWMPAAGDEDAPDVYAPWCDWAEIAASAATMRQQTDDLITAENWDRYGPAARKVALAALRRRDPAAARTVLEAKLASENADARLRLVELLATGLSDADVAFLEGIVAADRAPKVKALAASLLARLSRGAAAGDDIAELKGFFAVKMKGLLRRSRVIEFENAKTPAQRLRRTALFEGIDMASFASALVLAPNELIAAWSFDLDHTADAALVALVARTGTDTLVAQTAEAVSQCDAGAFPGLIALAPRLAPGQRSELAERVLRTRGLSFEKANTIAGGMAQLQDPLSAPAGAALLAALRRDDAKPSDQAAELFALGLLASRAGARQALDRLNNAGLLQGDPRLDMLRLNAALDDNGAKP
jgi:Family of unknown function (DUF5691)